MQPLRIQQHNGEYRIPMDCEEYLNWDYGGSLTEWVDGEVIIFMAATTTHQMLVAFLTTLLTYYVDYFQLGQVLTAPYAMRLRKGRSYREPDVLFIANAHTQRLSNSYLLGAATLVVEVVSPDSTTRDYHDKFMEYQKAGVHEYWVIDPIKKRAVFCFILTAHKLYELMRPDAEGYYHSTVIPGFFFHPDWVLHFPLPSVRTVLARIAPDMLHDKHALQQAQHNGIQIGEQRGIQIGEQRGIQIGEQRGIQIGEQQGHDKAQRAIALRMLALGIDRAIILQTTGLSNEDLAALDASDTSSPTTE